MELLFSVFIFVLFSNFLYAEGCQYHPPKVGTLVRPGFVEFMDAPRLNPLKEKIPSVSDGEIDSILKSPDTMWYDEESMVFSYQDSAESVVGTRANCVGRRVGETTPVVAKLMDYFGPDYRFVFPFRKAAGTDDVKNDLVINFWAPPRVNGIVLPVKYWRNAPRNHWYWTFPMNTVIGEILFQQGVDGTYYAYEIRTRKRYREGWSVNLFRPFATAETLADEIMKRRPDWQNSLNLVQVINHLKNPTTLIPFTLKSEAYGSVFSPIQGALDYIPEIEDKALVKELLLKSIFVSTEGKVWKKNGALETYAPSSAGNFSIVPKDYKGGMLAMNEVSCRRCHQEASRKIKHFNFDVQLYGEIWGEDQIFTWHLFEPSQYIYATFDESDSSTRVVNKRLVSAGLVKSEKPSPTDIDYRPLPSAFDLD